MKANELMIGDWVYVAHNGKASHFGKVTALLSSGAVETEIEGSLALSSSVEPIPLTAEIIEKNTDMKLVDSDSVTTYTFNDGIHAINVRMKGGMFSALGVPIPYVHDLQHALRLVGVDKEITI